LNLYTYCVNNPLIYVDPTGHSPKEAVFYKNLESQLPISEIAKKVKGASYSISKGSGTTIVSYNKKILTFDSSTITNMEDFYWAFGDVDSVGDKSPIIEAYDLLNMYSTTASCYSRLQIDSMYRNLFLDIQVEMMENQYKQQLDALQELMLENKAIQSNDEMFYSIGSYYENYSLFSSFYADKLTKVLRSDKRFSKVISDEISRRDIEFAKEATSFALDSFDIVGDVKGGAEALFGYNFIKQERLSNTERYITAGTTAAPFVFGAIAKRARPILKSIGSVDGITAKLTNKLLKRVNTGVVESKAFKGLKIGYGGAGRDVRNMKIIRQINKGEKITDIIDEARQLTYFDDIEHAVVSFKNGDRFLVSGGRHGIDIPKNQVDQIRRIIGHTHPYSLPITGPSGPDIDGLFQLGQKSSYLFEHGELSKFWRN
jgi:urease gamma subunit